MSRGVDRSVFSGSSGVGAAAASGRTFRISAGVASGFWVSMESLWQKFRISRIFPGQGYCVIRLAPSSESPVRLQPVRSCS